jgi:peptidoglycan/xylan/chitin deacetylase (PgdA/CDA1 family)
MGAVQVALTFDAEHPEWPAGDVASNAATILETLAAESIRASFFVQGRWASAYPALAAAMRSGGHLIGSHSHAHCAFPRLTDAGIVEDLGEARLALEPTVGETRPWFRLPQRAGREDARVMMAVDAAGYRHVDRTVAAGDWWPGRRPDELIAAVSHQVLAPTAAGTAVVLLHTWPDVTVRALPAIIAELRAHSAEFVTVDDVDDLPR